MYRRAARSVTPRPPANRSAVIPGLAWSNSSAVNARAVGLSSRAAGLRRHVVRIPAHIRQHNVRNAP